MEVNPAIKSLAEARMKLYCHLVALLLLATVMCATYAYFFDMDAISPSGRWFRDLFTIFAPGVAPSIVEFPSRYPILSLGFGVVIVMLRRTLSVLTDTEKDIARASFNGVPVPGVPAWCAAIPRFRWFVVVVVIFAGVAATDLRPGAACHGGCKEVDAAKPPGCGDVRDGCQLAPGEKVRVAMRADRARINRVIGCLTGYR